MYKDPKGEFDIRPLGREIKRRRNELGWSQAYLGQLVDCSQRSIMSYENNGVHPSLDTLYRIVNLLGISVDPFFLPQMYDGADPLKHQIDFLISDMDDREKAILLGTAESIKKARDS